MSFRTMCHVVALSFFFTAALWAQTPGELPSRGGTTPPLADSAQSLSGYVRGFDGQPIADARVELEREGRPVTDTYTNAAGAFEFDNLSGGGYHVRVTVGVDEIAEDVQVFGSSMVNLRMPKPPGSDIGTRDSVSVAQLKVPEKARDAYNKAQKDMSKEKLDDARRHIEEALQIAPGFSDALVLRGVLKLDSNDGTGAVADLEQAVQSDPNNAMAFLALGSAYNLQSRFQDALRVLDHGVGLSPRSWQGYFELGKAFLGQSDYAAALRQLNKAEELAPKAYAPVHLVKAHALLGMKDYQEAISELEAYLEKDPRGPQSDEARAVLDKARAFASAKR